MGLVLVALLFAQLEGAEQEAYSANTVRRILQYEVASRCGPIATQNDYRRMPMPIDLETKVIKKIVKDHKLNTPEDQILFRADIKNAAFRWCKEGK